MEDSATPDGHHTWLHLFPTVLFSTPLTPSDLEVQQAAQWIDARRADTPSPPQRGAFEWVSSPDLHTRREFAWLATAALNAANCYLDRGTFIRDGVEITEMWANVSEPGGQHRAHTHPNSWLSGVYYLSAPPGSGNISFNDPRPGPSLLRLAQTSGGTQEFTLQATVEPADNMLLLFPSWLTHAVGPNEATQPRVSVAFNLFPTGTLGVPSARLVHRPATEI